MEDTDGTLIVRHWHLEIWGYSLHSTLQSSCIYFSVHILALLFFFFGACVAAFCLPVYLYWGTCVFSPWRLLTLSASKELNSLNFISPSLTEADSWHTQWGKIAWTLIGVWTCHCLQRAILPLFCLKQNKTKKNLFVNTKYRGSSHNRCSKLLYYLTSKLFFCFASSFVPPLCSLKMLRFHHLHDM